MNHDHNTPFEINHDAIALIMAARNVTPAWLAKRGSIDPHTVKRCLDLFATRKIARFSTLERLSWGLDCSVADITYGYPSAPVKMVAGKVVPLRKVVDDAA